MYLAASSRRRSARWASGGEEVGDVEGDPALGEVEGVVTERVDEVVDGRLGVGVVGDGDDGEAPAVGVGAGLLDLLGADADLGGAG